MPCNIWAAPKRWRRNCEPRRGVVAASTTPPRRPADDRSFVTGATDGPPTRTNSALHMIHLTGVPSLICDPRTQGLPVKNAADLRHGRAGAASETRRARKVRINYFRRISPVHVGSGCYFTPTYSTINNNGDDSLRLTSVYFVAAYQFKIMPRPHK